MAASRAQRVKSCIPELLEFCELIKVCDTNIIVAPAIERSFLVPSCFRAIPDHVRKFSEAPRSFHGAKQHSGYTLAGCGCCSSFHEGTEVFRVGEEFSRAGTTVFDHREDVVRVCECLRMHGSCSCGCELF